MNGCCYTQVRNGNFNTGLAQWTFGLWTSNNGAAVASADNVTGDTLQQAVCLDSIVSRPKTDQLPKRKRSRLWAIITQFLWTRAPCKTRDEQMKKPLLGHC
jgi:hypothetical protein